MNRSSKKMSKKVGLPPGTLVHIGAEKTEKVSVTVLEYSEERFDMRELPDIEDFVLSADEKTVTWINVDGVHEMEVIEKVGKLFNLHPLTLEDIVNTGQTPKIEDYSSYLFVVLKMLHYDEKMDVLDTEQVSLCLGPNFLISFLEEKCKDIFHPVRERIRNFRGRIRKAGADYLAYTLIDMIVDNYFVILEKLGEKMELLEEKVMSEPTQKVLHELNILKREMIFLRRSVWPLREVLNTLERGESSLIQTSTRLYLRDVYDHSIRIIETIEAYRDILAGILDIYLSSISNRINAVMKVLTIIATIFMPLTFIAGVYGMNFRYMPELGWRLGYPLILILMAALGISMLLFFRKKKWM
jgi:magnesium transporter